MILLIAFAFLAGIVTVLSPCILPVLPIVLSSAVGADKRKPFGVVTGFVLSFTFFTLFLSTIVQATGISANAMRNVAVIIILVFGISLLIPQVQVWIEQMFSKLANRTPQQKKQRNGFFGGVMVGFSLGLLWTPCVGPILASVISLAFTGSVTGTALFITLAYSIGTALPMLAIIFGGRQLLMRVPWLLNNTGTIQKVFGIIMILTAVGIYFQVDRKFQTYILETFPQYGVGLTSFEDNEAVQERLDMLRPGRGGDSGADVPGDMERGKPMDLLNQSYPKAPEIQSEGSWINSDPLTIEGQKGNVVLVDFWTYSCINCIRTLPYLRTWHEKYADDGLVIIGVHTPEFAFEKDLGNLQEAVRDFELEYPIVQDNDYLTWRAYNNRYWPAKYLIDKDGRIRYTHFGEGAYDETETMIQKLLSEDAEPVTEEINNPAYTLGQRTPELYLGYQRIEYLASPQEIVPEESVSFSRPEELPGNTFAFQGEWRLSKEYAQPGAGAELTVAFTGKDVFLVMRTTDGAPAPVELQLDGQPVLPEQAGDDLTDSQLTVEEDRLYHLVSLPEPGIHTLTLIYSTGTIEAFAVTFG